VALGINAALTGQGFNRVARDQADQEKTTRVMPKKVGMIRLRRVKSVKRSMGKFGLVLG
jgi:hypothetical protein